MKVLTDLIVLGTDINATGKNGKIPLMFAIKNNNIEIIKFLLSNGADINARDKNGKSPLIFALEKRNNIKTIKFLLSAGADINTDLICAVQNNNIGIIADLIILGADINTKDKNGKTALSYAKDRKKTAIIKILKNAGAK